MKKEASYLSRQPRLGQHMLSEAQVNTVLVMHESGHAKALRQAKFHYVVGARLKQLVHAVRQDVLA